MKRRTKSLFSILSFGLFGLMPFSVDAKYNGSVSVTAHQRFFDDAKLGHVNDFSEWGAIGFDINAGIVELPFRIEPLIGFGFIKNAASLYKLNEDGTYALDSNGHKQESQDKIEYQLYTFSVGLREKFWEPDFFILIPFVQTGLTYRYGRVRKLTFGEGQQKMNVGGDFGAELGGGLLLSFFYDHGTRIEMAGNWGLKDFCLQLQTRYLPAGFGRQGLGLLSSTGGWDFGAGLFMDW